MKLLIGFIAAAPIWFAILILMNSMYMKVVDCFGPHIRVGYWLGISIASFSAAWFLHGMDKT